MDTPLRIAQLLAPAPAGGLESVVLELAAGLSARGHQVAVVPVLEPGQAASHPFAHAAREAGLTVIPLEVGGRAYREERRRVAALLQAHGVHVLHTHGYRPDVLDGSVAHRLGRTHITTLHGFIGATWRGRAYEWLQVRAARRADAAIAVSVPIERRLQRVRGPGRIVLLRNASTPPSDPLSRDAARAALGLPTSAFVVGWVGRLSHEKGPDVFAEAIARSGPELHGAMLGDGPERASLGARAQAPDLAGRLHLLGLRPQASRYLAAFDALALTSRTEGTPMVLLEAMWAGVPIVATAVGGVPDVVTPREALLISEVAATPIAAALGALATDVHGRAARVRAAATRVQSEFGIASWLDVHEALYREVIGHRT
jgi:glycosyltransferase involved in cell wall biosynthesis